MTLLHPKDAEFEAFDNPGVHLADALPVPDAGPMTAGWARYAAGARNDWTLDYDEVIVVIEGTFYIDSGGHRQSGDPGDVFYLAKGTRLTYGSETGALAVYVSYPDWRRAARAAGRL